MIGVINSSKKPLIEAGKTPIYIPQNKEGKIKFEKKIYDKISLVVEEECYFPNWISN